ncbi:FAD-dependent oxidoreductase [Pseudomonas chlororaphis]|nr:FAD-dependent oxidoreductase [Pseudomonas chlororaphis]
MRPEFDVIIVGSGPAGTSAAYPLAQSGLRVLMVDAQGASESPAPPDSPYMLNRESNEQQWKWMIGERFHALETLEAVSPKLRTPTHAHVFENYSAVNLIRSQNFTVVGSLATGGLSNAWGCGVARLSAGEFSDLSIPYEEMKQSYETVSRRMGISGNADDDLSDYFGLDEWSQPPLPLDKLHQQLDQMYAKRQAGFSRTGFRLGRSRVAVLSRDLDERKACDSLGNCLWGCHNKALYSSYQELAKLKQYPGFQHIQGMRVHDFFKSDDLWTITDKDASQQFSGRRLLLAAGTLASTRLTLKRLGHMSPLPLLSSPTAAFLLWLPRMLGTPRVSTFGLGQLSFTLDLAADVTAFGSTFSTTGLPISEFVNRLPMSKRYSIDLLKNLLSSCLVGNLFLPGHLSHNTVELAKDGSLLVKGGERQETASIMKSAQEKLRKSYFKLGAVLMPMSFSIGKPGADIHYAGTLPMHSTPQPGHTDMRGEVAGLPGVHLVDGSCLPKITEKSHTLTIMANADRIGRTLALDLC